MQKFYDKEDKVVNIIRIMINTMEKVVSFFDQIAFRINMLRSDRTFLIRKFQRKSNRLPDLNHPRSFSDKMTWLLLNYRPQQLTLLADKYEVRSYVSERIGSQYLIPLLGVYKQVEDINWSGLPRAFILKTNHGCGWNVICNDKSTFDQPKAIHLLKKWMQDNYYLHAREYVYRDIVPRIIVETSLCDSNGNTPDDYKIFCFHGIPKLIQIHTNRFTEHKRCLFSPTWKPLFWQPLELLQISREMPAPLCLDEMLTVAGKLSVGHPFVRIDLYNIKNTIFFGEITFFPSGGIQRFLDEYDQILGDWLSLPPPVHAGGTGPTPLVRLASVFGINLLR